MNKRQIIASLNNIANQLDFSGLHKEATSLTNVMKRIADDSDNDRVPLDKMPGMDTDSSGQYTLRNFDPLMPVEGQEISRDELWEKFLEYIRKYKYNPYTGYAYNMWQALVREHGMGKSNYRGYRNKLENTKLTRRRPN